MAASSKFQKLGRIAMGSLALMLTFILSSCSSPAVPSDKINRFSISADAVSSVFSREHRAGPDFLSEPKCNLDAFDIDPALKIDESSFIEGVYVQTGKDFKELYQASIFILPVKIEFSAFEKVLFETADDCSRVKSSTSAINSDLFKLQAQTFTPNLDSLGIPSKSSIAVRADWMSSKVAVAPAINAIYNKGHSETYYLLGESQILVIEIRASTVDSGVESFEDFEVFKDSVLSALQ